MKTASIITGIFAVLTCKSMAYDIAGAVANSGNNTMTIFNESATHYKVGSQPREVIKYNDLLIITECADKCIGIYDPNSMYRLGSINLPDEPRGLIGTKYGILSILKDHNKLITIDPYGYSFKELTSTSEGPRNIAYDSQQDLILISCNTANCLDIIDPESWTRVTSITTAKNPYDVTITKDYIVVSAIGDACIQAFSKQSYSLVWSTKNINHPTSLAHNGKDLLVSTNFDDHQIVVLNAQSGEILSYLSTRQEPFDVTFSEGLLLVTSHKEGYLQVFNSDDLQLKKEIKVGNYPHGMCIF
ncbi:YncE family protein [Candidatus Odyssella thessalonicensis]|uniref:YncE family protein n=1 Tax=Candidatus Odyssella thessalonicensis TaxID=84647 RepID=UPI000225A9A0|nr:hypothetical protein [Candidatus Odyssella thessalonicensis]